MYTEEDKRIFGPLQTPSGPRWYDPCVVYRTLSASTRGEHNHLLALLASEDEPERLAAQARLAEATCAAFELPPFDPATGEGFPEAQVLSIFNAYIDWQEDIKKKEGA